MRSHQNTLRSLSIALAAVVLATQSLGAQPRLAPDALPMSAAPEVRALVSELYAERASARAVAACELGQLGTTGEPAIPHLLSMLADEAPTPAEPQAFFAARGRGDTTHLDAVDPNACAGWIGCQ